MVGKAQKSHGARSGVYGGCTNGVPPIPIFRSQTQNSIQMMMMRYYRHIFHRGHSHRNYVTARPAAYSEHKLF
jgi:hypothetical protein